ncbi:MAG: NUDIX hydrolase [Myxococcales bacterium]|nr:NUDIX hydrolase [Myxococcales bacterium]
METITQYPRPSVAVDLVVFTVIDALLNVLLIRRQRPPFAGELALPGGFVRVGESVDAQGEDLDETARRELHEETGLPPSAVYLEQLHTFGQAGRDPRGRVISVVYFALVRPDLAPFVVAGGDASQAGWQIVEHARRAALAFDHTEMLELALARLRRELEASPIAFELVPTTFTIAELRSVYEVIMGKPYDPGNFRRRFQRLIDDGVIAQADGRRITSARPAKVYHFLRTAKGDA